LAKYFFDHLAIAAVELGDEGLEDMSYRYLGRSYAAQGEYSRALATFERGIRRPGTTHVRSRPWALQTSPKIWSAHCLSETGAFAAGLGYGEEAIRIAEANDQHLNLIAARAVVGRLYLRQGHPVKSADILERGLELCGNTNIPLLVPYTASGLGAAYALAGRAEGVALLQEAVDRADEMGRMVEQSLSVAWLSEAFPRWAT
jgi:tetratricopeptide (TPR) repeat protein